MTAIILEHAIYGSSGGLGDYRILASSAGLDGGARAKIAYYSSLDGSALSSEFAPIYSFFALTEERWAFTRTVYAGATPRGSDYVVHAIVLGRDALARLDYKPFTLSDAGFFLALKPPRDSVLSPLALEEENEAAGFARPALPAIAFSLRVLSKGVLRLRISEGMDAVAVCRAIHESLPPADRMKATFCTRFSYRRALDLRLAAFIPADDAIIEEQKSGAMIVATLPANPATPGDVYDRWVREVYGQPELELIGPSLLERPAEALASIENVRRLRQWTGGESSTFELDDLRDAAVVVLHPLNRDRPSIQPLLPGAVAVTLCTTVAAALTSSAAFENGARMVMEIGPRIRSEAARWIEHVRVEPLHAWSAELLLRLPDATLDTIGRLLVRADGSRPYLALLSSSKSGSQPLLAAVLPRLRRRFDPDATSLIVVVIDALVAERDAVIEFVSASERAAAGDPESAQQVWLTALVTALARHPSLHSIAARIVLSNELLASLPMELLDRLAPSLYATPDKLAPALAENALPALNVSLARVAYQELSHGRFPRKRSALQVLQRVLAGCSVALRQGHTSHAARITALLFLAATVPDRSTRAALREALAVTAAALIELKPDALQAAVLLRALSAARLLRPLASAGRKVRRVGVPARQMAKLRPLARQHQPATWSNAIPAFLRGLPRKTEANGW